MSQTESPPGEAGPQTRARPGASPAAAAGMADPGAWAVTAFAATSFMLGMYNAHILGAGGAPKLALRAAWVRRLPEGISSRAQLDGCRQVSLLLSQRQAVLGRPYRVEDRLVPLPSSDA
jgi:hypothetical protein